MKNGKKAGTDQDLPSNNSNSKMEQASDQRSERCESADLFVHFALQTCLISNGTEGEIVKNM